MLLLVLLMFAYGPEVEAGSEFSFWIFFLGFWLFLRSVKPLATCRTQALVDPSMSWKRQPDRKISFTPGKGISFMLASDVALYKEIKVTLSDQLIANFSWNRWLPTVEGLAEAPPWGDIENLKEFGTERQKNTAGARQHQQRLSLRRLHEAIR